MRKWNKNQNCISGDGLLAAYHASSALTPVYILLLINTILTPFPRRWRLIIPLPLSSKGVSTSTPMNAFISPSHSTGSLGGLATMVLQEAKNERD